MNSELKKLAVKPGIEKPGTSAKTKKILAK
jgi:hypothetical protein